MSLPLRERGLKYILYFFCYSLYSSLPLRERGLKFCHEIQRYQINDVAPLAGAWVEIWEETIMNPIA